MGSISDALLTFMPQTYRKHFLPLESNPEVFSDLIHTLGAPKSVSFADVFSLDDPNLLRFIPRPVLALILVFPTTPKYEEDVSKEDYQISTDVTRNDLEENGVMWFRQTINNACGLYAILHALANGRARNLIGKEPNSQLGQLFDKCKSLTLEERALILEGTPGLEDAHRTAALRGHTSPPENPEDEVDFHYVCIVPSAHDSHLFWMDGMRQGPIDLYLSLKETEDLLDDTVLQFVRDFIAKYSASDDNIGFNLMALVHGQGPQTEAG